MNASADSTPLARLLASAPATIDGFPAFAPELALSGEDYPPEMFPLLSEVEERSFWFQARNRILLRFFKRFVGLHRADVLEVGCGTGFVLSGLAREFPEYALTGAEVFVQGLSFARDRVPKARFIQMDATDMPFHADFDAIGFFDVLEHLVEDEKALACAHAALKSGGVLLATVPQHRWLWSSFDDASDHKRRYERAELVRKVRKAGFQVRLVTSFVTCLLPAMLLNRLRQRGPATSETVTDRAIRDLAPGGVVNAFASGLMRVDETLIGMGVSLPVGGSLAIVAWKNESPAT